MTAARKLTVNRKAGEKIVIAPHDDADKQTPLGILFADQPIEITLAGGSGEDLELAIAMPAELQVLSET